MPPGFHIHHKNEIRTDNRLENLELVTPYDHVSRHAALFRENGRRVGRSGQGVPKSPEHRQRIAAALTGKVKSPEHRQRIAVAITGKTQSPEQRAKMSASLREYHAACRQPGEET